MSSSPCVLAVAIPARLSTKKTSIDIYEINVDGLAEAAPPAQLTQQFTVSEEVKVGMLPHLQIVFAIICIAIFLLCICFEHHLIIFS